MSNEGCRLVEHWRGLFAKRRFFLEVLLVCAGTVATLTLAACQVTPILSDVEQRVTAQLLASRQKVAKPQYTPTAGSYSKDEQVTITDSTPGAQILYTFGTTTPTPSSTSYSAPIPVTGDGTSVTINAIAVENGMTDSDVATSKFAIQYPHTVKFDPQGGSTPNPTSISVAYNQPYGTLATTSRTAYGFGGWFPNTSGTGQPVTSTTKVQLAGDQTLYAHWVPSGSDWKPHTLPSSQGWDSIAFGNGVFVAVAGNSNVAATSSDGVTWTQRTLPSSQQWVSVTYANGLFVAVADLSNVAATSSDGVTWTQRTLPSSQQWTSVTYGKGIFLAVSAYGVSATSPDGVSWTPHTLPNFGAWVYATYGNGEFVALTNKTVSGNNVGAVSPDGVTWTQITFPFGSSSVSVTYASNVFVEVGDASGGATSPDGGTWTLRTLPGNFWYSSVAYGNGLFVTVGHYGTGSDAATSPDGVTWKQYTLPDATNWNSMAYGNGVFVVVVGGSNVAETSP